MSERELDLRQVNDLVEQILPIQKSLKNNINEDLPFPRIWLVQIRKKCLQTRCVVQQF